MQRLPISWIPPAKLPGILIPAMIEAHAQVMTELKRRQDELLDAALMETFPASDPVSVMRIT